MSTVILDSSNRKILLLEVVENMKLPVEDIVIPKSGMVHKGNEIPVRNLGWVITKL